MSDERTPMVRGIRTALSVVEHDAAEDGVCSLRAITFDERGGPVATVLPLSAREAWDLRQALDRIIDRTDLPERDR